jgi:hypothetical protein
MNFVSRLRAMGAAAVLLALAACAASVRPGAAEQIRGLRGRDVVALLHSGDEVLLRSPSVQGDSVYGGWVSAPGGDVRAAVALADIARVYDASRGLEKRQEGVIAGGWGLALQVLAVGAVILILRAMNAA